MVNAKRLVDLGRRIEIVDARQEWSKRHFMSTWVYSLAFAVVGASYFSVDANYRITVMGEPRSLALPNTESFSDFHREVPPVIVDGQPRHIVFGGIESFNCAGWDL